MAYLVVEGATGPLFAEGTGVVLLPEGPPPTSAGSVAGAPNTGTAANAPTTGTAATAPTTGTAAISISQ